jgi:hypothetical protein
MELDLGLRRHLAELVSGQRVERRALRQEPRDFAQPRVQRELLTANECIAANGTGEERAATPREPVRG